MMDPIALWRFRLGRRWRGVRRGALALRAARVVLGILRLVWAAGAGVYDRARLGRKRRDGAHRVTPTTALGVLQSAGPAAADRAL